MSAAPQIIEAMRKLDEQTARLRGLVRAFVRQADRGVWRDNAGLSLAAHPLVDEARAVLSD